MTQRPAIDDILLRLTDRQAVNVEHWPTHSEIQPEDLGLQVADNRALFWPVPPEMLDPAAITGALPELRLEYFRTIDSTNTHLVNLGAQSSIVDRLCVAEFQYGGRGRRGRQWLSPYARNLAISMGVGTGRSMPELGGLSLVVGLALADTFESLRIADVTLKWPNDVLVNGQKLSGILVELVQRGSAVECVIGMGINVHITDAESAIIDQAVMDLRRAGVEQTRTEILIRVVSSVRRYLRHFEREGFAPFVTAFNDLHAFHGQTCAIIQGKQTTTGEVIGIGSRGELILHTDHGEQRFHGGEVSLRPDPT